METNTESKNTEQSVYGKQNTQNTKTNKTDNTESSKEELVKTEQIENTPFTIITVENETRIALGQFAVTENLTGKEVINTIKQIKKQDWNMLIAVLGAITIQTVEQSYVKVHERMKKAIIEEITKEFKLEKR